MLLAVTLVAASVGPARGQQVRLDVTPAMVTDRNPGVRGRLPAARGWGIGATGHGEGGRVAGEVAGLLATLSLAEGSQTLGQVELRGRYRVVGPVYAEGSWVGRSLSPDPDGESLAFVAVGAFTRWGVTTGSWVWGRVAYIPYAKFAGSGGTGGGSAEAQFGIELQATSRLRAFASYAYQRVDRDLDAPDGTTLASPVEHDILRAGAAWMLRGGDPRR